MTSFEPEAEGVFVFPMSHAQARLWFLDQHLAEPAVYNIPIALRLEGPLRIPALKEGLRLVHQRHESLRTTFRWLEGQPRQVIAPAGEAHFEQVDLEGLPADEREARAAEWMSAEAARPFDLAAGPMLRTSLLRLGEESHILVLCMHHIVSDGWSMAVLLKELKASYRAVCLGEAARLPALPVQYADYSHWERQALQGDALEEHLAYWTRQLAEAPPLLDLPTDRSRPPVLSHRGARESIHLPAPLAEALKTLARGEGATLFMTLLAGFQILLARYCGQEDFVVGSPVAGRTRAELEPLIGFFVNMLPLRADLKGDPSVREVLARVRATTLGALAHQELPFERLVEALNPPRSQSHSPVFQAMFVLQNDPRPDTTFLGMKETPMRLENRFAVFDLGLSVWESGEGLGAELEYSTDLFDAATIQRMLGHFRRILDAMAAEPSQPIAGIPLLTEAERHRILVEWNDTACRIPQAPVHALFEAQALRTPAATAVVFGDQELSYQQLNARSNQIAQVLRGRGVGPGVRVAVLMDRSLELIAAFLGILKAGGAYVPLSPAHPQEQLAFILGDTEAPFLLTRAELLGRVPRCEATVFCVDLAQLAAGREDAPNPPAAAGPQDLAYVMYTSGSTGRPKGVEVLHRGIVRLLFGGGYVQLDASTRMLQAASVAFDAATFEIWGPLLHGGLCVLYPEAKTSPATLRGLLERHRINSLWLTSALFNSIIHYTPELLKGVRQLLIGGEALSLGHVRRALALLPETEIINGYGPTEATTFSCCHRIPRILDERARSIPIGRPIGNSTAYILDPRGEPVPIGVSGELHVGGLGVARGYLNLPELTAAAFIDDPFDPRPGARLYRTGDLARHLPDGTIEFLGRRDHQVKIRGHRIELGEIEAALARYPGISRSIVDVREDASGEKRIVAYLEANRRSDLASNLEGLGDFLRKQLPHYMLPDAFTVLDVLPMKNGKLDRQGLRDIPLSRAIARERISPSNPTQILIAQIWEELLGVSSPGILDDFFDLGGHSLLAFAMLARLEEVFGRKLPIASLYANATIQSLARLLSEGLPGLGESPLVQVQEGRGRPFFFLHGDFNGGGFYCRNLARHLAPEQPLLVIHPFGLAGQPAPLSMEAMAAQHLDLVRAVQPAGPYLLGGYCNGAMEAYEMAQQLRAAGEQVDLLLLVDPPSPSQEPPTGRLDPQLARLDPAALPYDQRAQLLNGLFLQAIGDYLPKPYPGRATLLRSETDPAAPGSADPGWKGLIPDLEQIGCLSGHIAGITRDAREIGQRIQACLDRAGLQDPATAGAQDSGSPTA